MEGEDTIKVIKDGERKDSDPVLKKLDEIKKALDVNTSAIIAVSEILRSELHNSQGLMSLLVLLSASGIKAQTSSSLGIREDVKSVAALLEKVDEGLRMGVDCPDDDTED